MLASARARRAARMHRREEEKAAVAEAGGPGRPVDFEAWERRKAAAVIQREWRRGRAQRRRECRPSARTRERSATTIQRAFREYKANRRYHIDEDNMTMAGEQDAAAPGPGAAAAGLLASDPGPGVGAEGRAPIRSFDEERSMRIRLELEKRVRARSAELAGRGGSGGGGAPDAAAAADELEHAKERMRQYKQLRYKYATPSGIQRQQQRSSMTFKRLTASAVRLSDLSIDMMYSDVPLPPATAVRSAADAEDPGAGGRGPEADGGAAAADGGAAAGDGPVEPRTRYERAVMLHRTLMEDAMLESKGIIIAAGGHGAAMPARGTGPPEDGGDLPGTHGPGAGAPCRTEYAMERERKMWSQWRKYARSEEGQ